jgi:hypothetical protein
MLRGFVSVPITVPASLEALSAPRHKQLKEKMNVWSEWQDCNLRPLVPNEVVQGGHPGLLGGVALLCANDDEDVVVAIW